MSTTATIFTPVRLRRRATGAVERLLASAICGVARLYTDLEVRWIGCAPADKQRIYVANHTSHADFILLWAALGAAERMCVRPVAAADYWTAGAVRRFLSQRVFRAIMIDRCGATRSEHPLAPVLRAIDRGESIIFFPEGTRGDGRELGSFKCGIYQLAAERPDVEIVPVWVENLHRVLPKGAILPVPMLCSVNFGQPLTLRSGEEKTGFLGRLRERLIALGATCQSTTKSS